MFQIIEYCSNLDHAIVDFWKNSEEGWNGQNDFPTLKEWQVYVRGGSFDKIFIALEDDVVIGFCEIKPFEYDKGAFYVSLLGTRDGHHGKGVGRELKR